MLSLHRRWFVLQLNESTPRLAMLFVGAVVSALSSALLNAADAQPRPAKPPVPALYPTRAEAEKAAKEHFHCTGAHPMGQQWMPCAQHAHDHGSHP